MKTLAKRNAITPPANPWIGAFALVIGGVVFGALAGALMNKKCVPEKDAKFLENLFCGPRYGAIFGGLIGGGLGSGVGLLLAASQPGWGPTGLRAALVGGVGVPIAIAVLNATSKSEGKSETP